MGSRRCTDCGHAASERARFCEHCGSALVPGATPLRAPAPLEARILEERTGITGERKQVTVMYADVVGSMDLTRALDSERWGFVLDRFLAVAAGAVHAYEGTVNQFTGDGLLAVFGAPLAHEDHARRACLAVLELQQAVAELTAEVAQQDGAEFAIRCGLNSGEVVVGAIGDDVHMDFVPVGNTTALGKRIEELAPIGSVAVSAATAALVEGEFELRELGEFDLKGMPTQERVLELVGRGAAQTRLQAVAAVRGLSRFVGRATESAELESALKQVLTGNGRAVGIVGDAGVGKSRLVHEFVADCAAHGLTVRSASAVAHGRYVPFLPVLALFRDYFDVDERDPAELVRERVAHATLAVDPAYEEDLPLLFEFLGVMEPERALEVVDPVAHRRRLLAVATRVLTARSREAPTVLVVEDLHWIDDASDAFLEELVGAVVGTQTMLIATYRSGYDDAWANEGPHARVSLDPLDSVATEDLIHELLGPDASLDGLVSMIEERTAGNPFFIEEVVQALVEGGHLTGVRGAYRLDAELDSLALPVTVQAGLGARIDRLPSREKALVQTMSVIGLEIPGLLLSEVSDLDERGLAEAMAVLARGQWVIPRGAGARREYVFKHPLTQEVAYGSQLSVWRARAHRTVTAAIERTYPDALDERAALLAHHSEAAGDLLTAAGWHARAAGWAEAASPVDCIRHWRRVRDLTSDLDPSPDSVELAAQARNGILSLGWLLGVRPEETAAIHAEMREVVEGSRADLYFSGSLMHSGRERDGLAGFRAAYRRAVADADLGRALTASTGVAYAAWVAGSLQEGVQTIDSALELVGEDPTTDAGVTFICPLAQALQSRGLTLGYLGEVSRAQRDFERALELSREYGDRRTASAAHANLALLEASAGNHEAAMSHATTGLAIAESAAEASHVIANSVPLAMAEAGEGRFADAVARAEADLDAIRTQRVGLYYEPQLLATIARSRLALGEPDYALAAADEAAVIAEARGLGTCAIAAPIALAQVLLASRGAAAEAPIVAALVRATQMVRVSGASLFDGQIRDAEIALAGARAALTLP